MADPPLNAPSKIVVTVHWQSGSRYGSRLPWTFPPCFCTKWIDRTLRFGADTPITISRSCAVSSESARGILPPFPEADAAPAGGVNARVPFLPVALLL